VYAIITYKLFKGADLPRILITMNHNSTYYKVFELKVTGADKKVMLAILKLMEIDMNTISLLGDTLEAICAEAKVSKQQVRNATSRLAKLHLLEPTKTIRGEYVINPSFAWKGNEARTWKFYETLEQQARNKASEATKGLR